LSFLDRIEKKLGWLAVPGLIRIVVVCNALVFFLMRVSPRFGSALDLDPAAVMRGEVWRLFTYIFIPQTTSWLWIVFFLLVFWNIGEMLEQAWGAFRLTLYYLLGMIGVTIAAFVFGVSFSSEMLYTSLFFAFARFYPDYTFYLFFILPVKVKWLAWIYAALLLVMIFASPMPMRMAIISAFANYLIFFLPGHIHDFRHRQEVVQRRQKFQKTAHPVVEPLHRCEVCQRTDDSDPHLNFRVSRDGHEYCTEHLPRNPAA